MYYFNFNKATIFIVCFLDCVWSQRTIWNSILFSVQNGRILFVWTFCFGINERWVSGNNSKTWWLWFSTVCVNVRPFPYRPAHFNQHLLMDFPLFCFFFTGFDETHKGNSIVLPFCPNKTISLTIRTRHSPNSHRNTNSFGIRFSFAITHIYLCID